VHNTKSQERLSLDYRGTKSQAQIINFSKKKDCLGKGRNWLEVIGGRKRQGAGREEEKKAIVTLTSEPCGSVRREMV